MQNLLEAPVTQAQQQRDVLIGSLVGLARSTVNEPKTEDTDRILGMGLRLAAKADAGSEELKRMTAIVQNEKHRVAPNCATCTMKCGNTNDYDLARMWAAQEPVRTLKQQLLACMFTLAEKAPSANVQEKIDQGLFVLAEDWDEDLLAPVVQGAMALCAE